jgi:guanylate kinase
MKKGNLFVVAAPSGAGKTSLVRALVQSVTGIIISVSHTTRSRREGEEDGVHYHFVTPEQFRNMVTAGLFLEHATVFDRSYGTARDPVMERLSEGIDVILEIDWQGARQIRATFPGVVGIFILPPSRATLQARLVARAQDSPETISRRMRDAVSEMTHYREFEYAVVNDTFAQALEHLKAIILATRLKLANQDLDPFVADLMA